jgi:hypothetical protein
MGSGCTLRTNIYFSHKNYQRIEDVEDEIKLHESFIANAEKDLMMLLVMTEPDKFWRKDEAEVGETPWIWMQNEAQRCLETIKESSEELAKLRTLLYEWSDCHDKEGFAIEPFKGSGYDKPYFWGDWIKSVYPDGNIAHDPEEILKKNWQYDHRV